MKTYRVQLWSGIDPDRLQTCATYIYMACKANREFAMVHAFNPYPKSIPKHIQNLYISISNPEEFTVRNFVIVTLCAYKRLMGENSILFDSIKEII